MPGIRESEQETRDGSGAAVRAVKTAAPVLGEVSRVGREEVSGWEGPETGQRQEGAGQRRTKTGSPVPHLLTSTRGHCWQTAQEVGAASNGAAGAAGPSEASVRCTQDGAAQAASPLHRNIHTGNRT